MIKRKKKAIDQVGKTGKKYEQGADKMKGQGLSRMAQGEREGELPTEGSGKQSSKTHGE